MSATPAPAAWSDTDPLMQTVAAAVWEHCRTEGSSTIVDDPRTIAAVAVAAVRGAAAPADRAAEVAQLRVDGERKDREFATCERLLREAYEEIANLRRPANEAQQAETVEQDAIRRVRAVLETEAVVGRRALEYRGLMTAALMADEAQPTQDLAAADNPTPLRWGLNDVMWGDDDTVTVLLSGPNREPYWLELDPERAAVLRQDLAGPDGPADEAQQSEAPSA